MKYSLKNLNTSIDKWIASKRNLAPDKDYTESFLRERYSDLVNNFDGFKKFINNPQFKTAYHKYKTGDFNYLEQLFSNDNELILSLDEKQRDELLKEKKIKLIVSGEEKKNRKKQTDEKIFSPLPIKRYEITYPPAKVELFKPIKKAITILEIKRKLDGSRDPLKNTNEKHIGQMRTTDCFDYNECISYIEKIEDFELHFENPHIVDIATN